MTWSILAVMKIAHYLLLTVCVGLGCASWPDPTSSAINERSRTAAAVCGRFALGGEQTRHHLYVDGGTGTLLGVDTADDGDNPTLAMCVANVFKDVQIPSTRRGWARIQVSLDWSVPATSASNSTDAASSSNNAPGEALH